MSIFKDDEKGVLTSYPKHLALISGVWSVFHIGNRFQLRYMDGSKEEAVIPDPVQIDFDNHFSVVSTVQKYARG